MERFKETRMDRITTGVEFAAIFVMILGGALAMFFILMASLPALH